ncbi:MAG: alpha/beta hydrolase [Suilimivivens sp.]
MIHEKIDMTVEGSVGSPDLTTYIIDYSEMFLYTERPLILICPGGGYNHLSPREGELLALQFNAMGYHAAVLHYSVTPAVYPTQLLEIAKAMVTIRRNAKEWHVDTEKILIQGSSAGGHLAASLGCFFKKDWLKDQAAGGDAELLRPNGMILNYPVITSGEFAHRGSFQMLLGNRYEELVEEMSLENRVNEDTPKTFIWHTYEDATVPMENSLLFVQALRRKNIPVEFHLYPKGGHGLGLGNKLTCSVGGKELQPEINTWISLAGTFIENL